MLVFNLPQNMAPMRTAKGVNPASTQVMPPQPMFQPPQFNNYFSLRSDASIMGYNNYGNFTATSMTGESQHRAMVDMANNMSIVGLTNNRRRRNF